MLITILQLEVLEMIKILPLAHFGLTRLNKPELFAELGLSILGFLCHGTKREEGSSPMYCLVNFNRLVKDVSNFPMLDFSDLSQLVLNIFTQVAALSLRENFRVWEFPLNSRFDRVTAAERPRSNDRKPLLRAVRAPHDGVNISLLPSRSWVRILFLPIQIALSWERFNVVNSVS